MVTSDWGGQCTWYRRGWSSGFTGEVTFAQSLPPPPGERGSLQNEGQEGWGGGPREEQVQSSSRACAWWEGGIQGSWQGRRGESVGERGCRRRRQTAKSSTHRTVNSGSWGKRIPQFNVCFSRQRCLLYREETAEGGRGRPGAPKLLSGWNR